MKTRREQKIWEKQKNGKRKISTILHTVKKKLKFLIFMCFLRHYSVKICVSARFFHNFVLLCITFFCFVLSFVQLQKRIIYGFHIFPFQSIYVHFFVVVGRWIGCVFACFYQCSCLRFLRRCLLLLLYFHSSMIKGNCSFELTLSYLRKKML